MKTYANEPISLTTADQDQFTKFTGLTKREYFAAKMMQAMMGNNEVLNAAEDLNEVALGAVKVADALIDALNKEEE